MRKNKLYIILSILTVIFFFTTSALCTRCAASAESPSIELNIYEGPDYSESDNMCYYIVEAIIAGSPEPEVEFNIDDNVSLLGNDRVEVGVDIGNSYTLTATATNSSGTASASIVLLGECEEEPIEEEPPEEEAPPEEEPPEEEAPPEEEPPEEEPPEEEAPPEEEPPEEEPPAEEPETTVTLNVVGSETGTIMEGDPGQVTNSYVYAGDWFNNLPNAGYISFNIESLHGRDIQSATLVLDSPAIYGTSAERQFLGWLWIGTLDYGTGALSVPDREIDADDLVRYNTFKTDISYSDDNLVLKLQDRIDSSESRIQFKLYWTYDYGTTDDDNQQDGNRFEPGNIHLDVTY